MADISKIQLPSGNVYNIKDEVARQMIAGGISFIVTWDGTAEPVVANIPAGVVVRYNGTDYTGTLPANSAQPGAFYLVKSSTQEEVLDVYDEYVPIGETGSKTWEKIGDTKLDLSDLGALAYKDRVNLSKGSGKQVLGALTGYGVQVILRKTRIKATASGTAVSAQKTQVLTGITPTMMELDTDTVPNVTGVGAPSTWGFAMGSGADAETLIISGANGSAPTLGTPKTVAVGTIGNGYDNKVASGAFSQSAEDVVSDVSVSAQPTIELSTGAAAGQGVIQLADGTVEEVNVTPGRNDLVTVAEYGDLDVSAS